MEVPFIKLFIVAFFLNLVWEVLHSALYTTCHQMPLGKVQRLLVVMSLKDAFWICVFFGASILLFGSLDPFFNLWQLVFFTFVALGFSFIDERVSTHIGRWEYASSMPTVLGVGVTPLLEVAVTGVAALSIVFFLL